MASGYSDLSEICKDGRSTYGAHNKPPKINLLNEKPRRESLIEQQLTTSIVRPAGVPFSGVQLQLQQQQPQQQVGYPGSQADHHHQFSDVRSQQGFRTNTSNEWSYIDEPSPQYSAINRTVQLDYGLGGSSTNPMGIHHQRQGSSWQSPFVDLTGAPSSSVQTQVTRTVETTAARSFHSDLAADLAAKEEKLKQELAYLNQHQGPWSRPRQTREPRREPPPKVMRNDQRWVRECPSGSSSRPTSRASSTRSTTEADLMEKASKLLQDVEELERKPMNSQQILIESGARRSMDRDQATNQQQQQQQSVSSIHTAVIKVPAHEPNNKSPLPFAFDNFSTHGVRGNIASVGAAEPDTPYPPIFPTIKRTPSPTTHRRS